MDSWDFYHIYYDNWRLNDQQNMFECYFCGVTRDIDLISTEVCEREVCIYCRQKAEDFS